MTRFVKYARHPTDPNSHISANSFIPYPTVFKTRDIEARRIRDIVEALPKMERDRWFEKNSWPKDGYNQGGYAWCCENWGTKWDFANTSKPLELIEGGFVYTFDTAWSPPRPVVLKMSTLFPRLIFTLRYWEGGMAFKGTFKVHNGYILKDVSSHYFGGRGG